MSAPEHDVSAAPRVLVDLAALERVPLAPGARARGPHAFGPASAPRAPEWSGPDGGAVERRALVTIGRLARAGRIVLCSYAQFEPPGGPDDWHGSWRALLGDVPVFTIESALTDRALGEDVFRDGAQSGALMRLCTRLKQWETAGSGSDLALPPSAERARPLARFHELAARVQGSRLADVYHLWTAECAGCPWWLTLDRDLGPFLRAWVEPGLRRPLGCEPVSPDALLTRLGIAERDPLADVEHRVVSLRPRAPDT